MTELFKYTEDYDYFEKLLQESGGVNVWSHIFDMREPDTKRREFGKIRNKVFTILCDKNGPTCQLKCHEDCSNVPDEVDHLVPLETNVLNKKLRGMRGLNGKKVPSISYGSNHTDNLVLACKRCNAFKKHRLPSKELITRILAKRFLP